jgi:hypothetical protein
MTSDRDKLSNIKFGRPVSRIILSHFLLFIHINLHFYLKELHNSSDSLAKITSLIDIKKCFLFLADLLK